MQIIVSTLVGAGAAAVAFALLVSYWGGNLQGPAPSAKPEPQVAAAGLSENQRADVEKTIEKYLLGNPQILVQMSEALERHQNEQRVALVRKTISEQADEIFRDGYGLEAGNPDGDVTVVEFSDYNCPYCKRAFNHVRKLIEKDAKVRVVLKEFPIFGERSRGAARVAIAAGKQGKYFEMHSALLRNPGQNNEATALKLAEQLGLDVDKLREDMKSDEVKTIIDKTRELGNKLGIQGTPFYLVGDKVIPGAPEDLLEVFEKNVAEIRKDGCQVGC